MPYKRRRKEKKDMSYGSGKYIMNWLMVGQKFLKRDTTQKGGRVSDFYGELSGFLTNIMS